MSLYACNLTLLCGPFLTDCSYCFLRQVRQSSDWCWHCHAWSVFHLNIGCVVSPCLRCFLSDWGIFLHYINYVSLFVISFKIQELLNKPLWTFCFKRTFSWGILECYPPKGFRLIGTLCFKRTISEGNWSVIQLKAISQIGVFYSTVWHNIGRENKQIWRYTRIISP